MLMALGFILVFVNGGITGVMIASPPIDFAVNDTYFIVSHFHYIMVGGLLFGMFAGFYFWFPKFTGRLLSERTGCHSSGSSWSASTSPSSPSTWSAWTACRRRIADYQIERWGRPTSPRDWGVSTGVSVLLFLWNFVVSIRRGAPAGDDPWEGNSLEWVTTSPPPLPQLPSPARRSTPSGRRLTTAIATTQRSPPTTPTPSATRTGAER